MQWRRRRKTHWVIGSAERSLLIRHYCLSLPGEGQRRENDGEEEEAGELLTDGENGQQHSACNEYVSQKQFHSSKRGTTNDVRWGEKTHQCWNRARGYYDHPLFPPSAPYPMVYSGVPPYSPFYYPSQYHRCRPLQPLDWFNPRTPSNCSVYYALSHPRYSALKAVQLPQQPQVLQQEVCSNGVWTGQQQQQYSNPVVGGMETLLVPQLADMTSTPPPLNPYVYPGYSFGPTVYRPNGYVSPRSQSQSSESQVKPTLPQPKKKRKRQRKRKKIKRLSSLTGSAEVEDDDDLSGSSFSIASSSRVETDESSSYNVNMSTKEDKVVMSLSALARQVMERAVAEAADQATSSKPLESKCQEGDAASGKSVDDLLLDLEKELDDDAFVSDFVGGAGTMTHKRDFPPLPLVNNLFTVNLVDDIVTGALRTVCELEMTGEGKHCSDDEEPQSDETTTTPSTVEEVVIPPPAFPLDTGTQQMHQGREPVQGSILSESDQLNDWPERNGYSDEQGGERELLTEIVFISETSFMDNTSLEDDVSHDSANETSLNPDAPAFVPSLSDAAWQQEQQQEQQGQQHDNSRWSDDEDERQDDGESSTLSLADSLKATCSLLQHATSNDSDDVVLPSSSVDAAAIQPPMNEESARPPTMTEPEEDEEKEEEDVGALQMEEELEEELGTMGRSMENYNPVRYKDYYQICSNLDVPDSPLEIATSNETTNSDKHKVQSTASSAGVIVSQPAPSPCPPSVQHPLPLPLLRGSNQSEIVLHEVDDVSECGSEDVETIGHRYDALADPEKKHIYVNQMSLAAELLRTRQALPYDEEFKPVDDDEVNDESRTNRDVYDRYYGQQQQRASLGVELQELDKTHRSGVAGGVVRAREASDSGVQSEESGDETDERGAAGRKRTRVVAGVSPQSHAGVSRQPLSAVLKGKSDPLCLCCEIM